VLQGFAGFDQRSGNAVAHDAASARDDVRRGHGCSRQRRVAVAGERVWTGAAAGAVAGGVAGHIKD